MEDAKVQEIWNANEATLRALLGAQLMAHRSLHLLVLHLVDLIYHLPLNEQEKMMLITVSQQVAEKHQESGEAASDIAAQILDLFYPREHDGWPEQLDDLLKTAMDELKSTAPEMDKLEDIPSAFMWLKALRDGAKMEMEARESSQSLPTPRGAPVESLRRITSPESE